MQVSDHSVDAAEVEWGATSNCKFSVLSGMQANLFIFLSWRDPKAYAEVQNATAAYQNGGSCNRYCNGQLASGPIVQW